MKVRPNSLKDANEGKNKNDLYIKFKIPFNKILDKDFDEFGAYNNQSYVSVDKNLETEIKDFFDNSSHGIYPLIGSTGIGKTHLIMNILKTYYGDSEINSNFPYIIPVNDNQYDVVLCCAHEKYNKAILSNLTGLLFSRVKTINDKIQKFFPVEDAPKETIEQYYDDLKPEIANYIGEAKNFAQETMRLKYFLSQGGINFRNFILIYDDLESLDGNSQLTLIADLLALYECLRNKKSKTHRTNLKFMFCLRTITYSNLATRPNYDTHRVRQPLILTQYPSLSELFETRFNLCVDNFNLLEGAGNKDTWLKAKEILMSLSVRLDSCCKDLLIRINNYNISDALEDFMKILTNRKWTQKNRNLRQSFKIREEEYYINNVNIFRVLFLGENDVYAYNNLYNYPSLFIDGRNRQQDILCLYILRFFSKRFTQYQRTHSFNALSFDKEEAIDIISSILYEREGESGIEKKVDRIMLKLIEYKFLEKDFLPKENEDTIANLYYITSYGNIIFEEFFKSNILFSIFRDEMVWDDSEYNIKCTCDLSQEELNEEYYKYICEIWSIEKEYFSLINTDIVKKDDYLEFFGDTSLSQMMLDGLLYSINAYYKNENESLDSVEYLVKKIIKKKKEIEREVNLT